MGVEGKGAEIFEEGGAVAEGQFIEEAYLLEVLLNSNYFLLDEGFGLRCFLAVVILGVFTHFIENIDRCNNDADLIR